VNKVACVFGAALLAIPLFPIEACAQASQYVLHKFKKIQLSNEYWSEGAAIGDIDRDGKVDAIVPPFWYSGPDFKTRHSFYPANNKFTFTNPDGTTKTIPGFNGGVLSTGERAFADTFLAVVADFNGDGWPDILVGAFANLTPDGKLPIPAQVPRTMAYWYENPGAEGLRAGVDWKRHIVTDEISSESLQYVDLLGDGHPVLLGMHDHRVGYFKSDPKDSYSPWIFYPISEKSDEYEWYNHGLGFGDITNSGRNDIVYNDGWWKQPEVNDPARPWKFSPYPFQVGPDQFKLNTYAPNLKVAWNVDIDADGVADLYHLSTYGGSQMSVYDVNGDGLPDIITTICAHKFGLVWWEQLKDHDPMGNILFKRHTLIYKKPSDNKYGLLITQMQALAMTDIDGDGLKDIVTGKHFWAHGNGSERPFDPDPNAPAVLYWFKLVRSEGSVDFVPYLIDDDSGTGNQITIGDIGGRGLPDIVTANKKGAFVFLHETAQVTQDEWTKAQPPVLYPAAKQ
jgi:FG-GAP repeat